MEEKDTFNEGLKHCDGILFAYKLDKTMKPAATEEGRKRQKVVEEVIEDLRKRIEKEIK